MFASNFVTNVTNLARGIGNECGKTFATRKKYEHPVNLSGLGLSVVFSCLSSIKTDGYNDIKWREIAPKAFLFLSELSLARIHGASPCKLYALSVAGRVATLAVTFISSKIVGSYLQKELDLKYSIEGSLASAGNYAIFKNNNELLEETAPPVLYAGSTVSPASVLIQSAVNHAIDVMGGNDTLSLSSLSANINQCYPFTVRLKNLSDYVLAPLLDHLGMDIKNPSQELIKKCRKGFKGQENEYDHFHRALSLISLSFIFFKEFQSLSKALKGSKDTSKALVNYSFSLLIDLAFHEVSRIATKSIYENVSSGLKKRNIKYMQPFLTLVLPHYFVYSIAFGSLSYLKKITFK